MSAEGELEPTLITGAAGNLGSRLAKHLALSGHPLRLMVHRTPLPGDLEQGENVTIVRADLARPETLADALRGVGVVVHFAGVLDFFSPRRRTDHRREPGHRPPRPRALVRTCANPSGCGTAAHRADRWHDYYPRDLETRDGLWERHPHDRGGQMVGQAPDAGGVEGINLVPLHLHGRLSRGDGGRDYPAEYPRYLPHRRRTPGDPPRLPRRSLSRVGSSEALSPAGLDDLHRRRSV
ncbi:MAG: NAD(P)H-binding protein [Thermoanaerobaculia bacterium]